MSQRTKFLHIWTFVVFSLAGQDYVFAQGAMHACERWESSVAALSQQDRTLLTRYGVIYRKEWIFSDQLVRDCGLRVKIAWYFRRVIQGRIDASVTRFAWIRSEAIDAVLERVWPHIAFSEALPSDGSFESEAWALLRQPWVSSETYGRVMQRELAQRGLSRAAVFTLLGRPTLAVRSELLRLVAESESRGRDRLYAELVSALVLLDILEDPAAAGKLRLLLNETALSETERSAVQTMVQSIGRGEPVEWANIEALYAEW